MEEMDKVDSGVINLFNEYKNQNNIIKELRETNEKLLNENYRMKAQINELGQQLQENIGQCLTTESGHVLYINLREKYESLSKQIENSKQEKEILMRHYEEKNSYYKNELERQKENVELRENELKEKFQVQQASMALENDELESKWQTRLDIINQQLKESNTTCTILRNQLADVKQRFSCTNAESEKRIQELEESFVTTEENLRRAQEKLIDNRQVGVQTYRSTTKTNLYVKNRPYSYAISRPNSSQHSAANDRLSSNSRYYEPLHVNSVRGELSKSDSQTNYSVDNSPKRLKRRKLYNPNEFVE